MSVGDTYLITGDFVDDGGGAVPTVGDVLWASSEGSPVDPSYTITQVQDNGGSNYTFEATKSTDGTDPSSGSPMIEDPYADGFIQLTADVSEGTLYALSPPSGSDSRRFLVAAANDEIWWESAPGIMSELTAANGDIDTSSALTMATAYQKCFVANGSNLKVIDFLNDRIETDNIGSNAPDKGTVLTGGTSHASMVVDYITSDSGASKIYGYSLNTNVFSIGETVGDGDSVSFIVKDIGNTPAEDNPNPPHWYDWTVFAGSTSYGAMPTKATLVCLYRGRLVLSGHEDYPHQWWMSRQGDPWDFLFTGRDTQSAISGNDSNAGEVGDIITCLAPYKDDFMIIGCLGSIWKMNGDPAAGGNLVEVSLTTGIWGARSFCWDNNDNFYFFGDSGLFILPPGHGTRPINITKFIYPQFPNDLDINIQDHRVTLGYDKDRHGVLVCITKLSDGTNYNYWLDLKVFSMERLSSGIGFFPETYDTDLSAYSLLYYDSHDPDDRQLIVGCQDGYLRFFDDDTKNDILSDDSNSTITSRVSLGPILPTGDPDTASKLISLSFVTAEDTDGVTFKIVQDRTGENVLTKLEASPIVPRVTGTFTDLGRPKRLRQRVWGIYFGLEIGNSTASQTWGFETLALTFEKAGQHE